MVSIAALPTVCGAGGCESIDSVIGWVCDRFGDDDNNNVEVDSLWWWLLRSVVVVVVDLEQSTSSERRLSFLSSRGVDEFTGLLSSS